MNLKTFFLFFFGLCLLAWFTSIAIAPLKKMKEFQAFVDADSVFLTKFDSTYYHPEMGMLLKEKTYKEALLELAESDSIQLVINLSDSTVSLSIKGVTIHQTRVSEIFKDKFLRNITLMQELKLFSIPLAVHSQFATIVKEPVIVRHAPKDTLEAALNAWKPDTLIQNPAFVAFSAEHNIRVIFEQENCNNFHDNWKRFGFYNHLRFRKTMLSVKNLINFRGQDYQPGITIKMPVDELRAIYRALPEESYIVFKL